jgi:flagellar basal-body rod modification protein FlgD
MPVSTSNPRLNIPVYTNNGVQNQNQPSKTNSNNAADQTQNFLKLLVAQIQNQDPMSPMDASTMTNQMSQLNMVSSMGTMNSSLSSMLSQMQNNNFVNQTAMIGHTPLIAGNSITFDGANNVALGANLAAPVNNLVATIQDGSGKTIGQINLGAANAGMKTFAWSGKDGSGNTLPAGQYSLKFSGTDTAGVSVTPVAFVGSPVTSVAKGAGSTVNFTLQNGQTVDASTINQWVS